MSSFTDGASDRAATAAAPTTEPTIAVPGRRGVRLGPVAGVFHRRYALGLGVVVVALVAVLVASVSIGTFAISLDHLFAVFIGQGQPAETLIVDRRLVRVVGGMLVGAALGAAGGVTQSLTRNPLASPDILGVTAGAGVLAVMVIITPIAGVAAAVAVPAAAMIGGLAVTAIVVAFAWRRGLDPLRLVLVGIGITAICQAITQWILMIAELEWAAVAMRWLTGSLEGVTWTDAAMVAVVVIVAGLVLAVLTPQLAAIRLGEDVARSLGVRAGHVQLASLVAAVALVAVATAAAGPVGFVAFVAPQIALRVFGTAGPPVFAAGLTGALLVSAADFTTRFLPVSLPVGIITSFLGGIVLITLLSRYVRRSRA